MNLMHTRFIHLKQALAGYLKTGIPLVEFDGNNIIPSLTADDIGIYILIPKIATFFNFSIEHATNIFFYTILLVPALIGTLGFWKYYEQLTHKILASFILILLCRQAFSLGDVYLSYYACPIMLIPWALYLTKKDRFNNNIKLYSFCAGFITGFFQFIRAFSGIDTALFILSIFFFKLSTFSYKKYSVLTVLFLCGVGIPSLYFNQEYKKSISYFQNFHNNLAIGNNKHIFWHNIYIGFGLLKPGNNDNIEYNDNFGFSVAQKEDPMVIENTIAYEEIIKNKTIGLVKNNLQFVLFTIFAKIGIMLFYLFKYANIGLFFALIYRKPWYLELPFWISLAFYALFPILTMPTLPEYSLGFITCAALYGLVSINYAIQQGFCNDIKMFFRRIIMTFKSLKTT